MRTGSLQQDRFAGRGRTYLAVLGWTVLMMAAWGFHGLSPGPADAQAEQRGARESEPLIDGELLWQRDCASCHGARGDGTRWGPSLHDKGPAGVRLNITTGRMPMELLSPLSEEVFDQDQLQVMPDPERRNEYLPEQVDALTAYAREILEGPEAVQVDTSEAELSRGQHLFQSNCASCHMWSGRGGILPDGHIATSLERSTPEEVVAAMRTGIGTMPLFTSEMISDEDATAIAAYVEYLQHPETPGGGALAYIGPVAEGFMAWVGGVFVIVLFARWIGGRG